MFEPKHLSAALYELTENDAPRPADEALMYHLDALDKCTDWAAASHHILGFVDALRSEDELFQCVTCTDWFRRVDIVRDDDNFCSNCYAAAEPTYARPVAFYPMPSNMKGR